MRAPEFRLENIFSYPIGVFVLLMLSLIAVSGSLSHGLLSALLLNVLTIIIGLKSIYKVPFTIFSFMYALLFMSGQYAVDLEILEFPSYYSSLDSTAAFEFSLYWLSLAVAMNVLGLINQKKNRCYIATEPSLALMTLMWAFAFSVLIIWMDWSSPLFRILITVFFPALSVSLFWKLNDFHLRGAVFLASLVPSLVLGSRHITGQLIVWVVAMVFVYYRGQRVRISTVIAYVFIILVLGISAFTIGTVSKYGSDKVFQASHYINRMILVQSHATARMIDESKKYPQEINETYGVGDYWLSLIPGIDKPVNAGHVTYELSRDSINKKDLPYLPPGAPGELYVTGGVEYLVLGGVVHGALIVLLWSLAISFNGTALYSSFFAGASVMLCGIGTPSLYGRINSLKEVFATLIVVGLSMAIMASGKILKKTPQV